MTCRWGSSELQMQDRRRRRREPVAVTQLVFVTLLPALSYSAGTCYEEVRPGPESGAGDEKAPIP
jgi:hypothetical protein